MLGFLIFLPTVFFIPHYFYLLAFLYLLFKKESNFKININEAVFVGIVFLMLINYLIHVEYTNSITDILPYPILLIVTLLVAKNLKFKDLQILLFLIVFESIIGIIEFKFGIRDILGTSNVYRNYSEGLLYFNSVRGLSGNIAPFVIKIIIGFILLKIIKPKKIIYYISYIILITVLMITFRRAGILAVVSFEILYFLFYSHFTKKQISVYIGIFITVCIYLYKTYLEIILNQVTKGTGKIEGSGREIIWSDYFKFIDNNFYFGNGSYKLFLNSDIYGIAHAHNSFIQFFSTNGFFIFSIFMIWILINVRKYNIIYLVPIVVFSLFNYGIFWGISIFDIILLYILLYFKNNRGYIK